MLFKVTEVTTAIPNTYNKGRREFCQELIMGNDLLRGLACKGIWVAVEGVVIHAAAKVAGGGQRTSGWRTLNFSEGTWHAHRRVQLRKWPASEGEPYKSRAAHLGRLGPLAKK